MPGGRLPHLQRWCLLRISIKTRVIQSIQNLVGQSGKHCASFHYVFILTILLDNRCTGWWTTLIGGFCRRGCGMARAILSCVSCRRGGQGQWDTVLGIMYSAMLPTLGSCGIEFTEREETVGSDQMTLELFDTRTQSNTSNEKIHFCVGRSLESCFYLAFRMSSWCRFVSDFETPQWPAFQERIQCVVWMPRETIELFFNTYCIDFSSAYTLHPHTATFGSQAHLRVPGSISPGNAHLDPSSVRDVHGVYRMFEEMICGTPHGSYGFP